MMKFFFHDEIKGYKIKNDWLLDLSPKMSFVLYPDVEEVADLDLKLFRDEAFEKILNGFPSDRYAYTLQWFSSRVNKGSYPQQMVKMLDYCKQNNLTVFNDHNSHVCLSYVYQTNGNKAKKTWSNLPFPPNVWTQLCDLEVVKQMETKIEKWNANAELKLSGVPAGAKLDLATTIGHFQTSDPKVHVAVIIDRFDGGAFPVIDKENSDPTRITLHYKFNSELIAAATPEDASESDVAYLRGIHSFSRVSLPVRQFFDYIKKHGQDFLAIIDKNDDEEENPAKKMKQ